MERDSVIYRFREGAVIDQQKKSAERREVRMGEVLGQRHETAVAAYRAEAKVTELVEQAVLAQADPADTDQQVKEYINENFPNAPEDFRNRFMVFAERYVEGAYTVYEKQEWLESEAGIEGLTGQEWEERLGAFVFEQRTGNPPKGCVRFKREGAFFIMTLENKEDYGFLAKEKNPQDQSGGIYKHLMPIRFFDSVPNVLILNASISDQSRIDDVLIPHESQHFINHQVFKLSEITSINPEERMGVFDYKPKEYWSYQRALRDIKDEFLAYTRDGSLCIKEYLFSPLYQHLFGKKVEEQEKLKRIVTEVSDALDHIFPLFPSKEDRAVLVYQLMDIPLDEMPKWIKEIGNFYERVVDLEMLGEKIRNFTIPRLPFHFVRRALQYLPDEYGESTVQVKKIVEKMNSIQVQAERLATTLPASSPSKKNFTEIHVRQKYTDTQNQIYEFLKELRMYKDILEKKYQFGGEYTFIPSKSDKSYSYFHKDFEKGVVAPYLWKHNYRETKKHTPDVPVDEIFDRASKAVVKTILLYPQKEIDAIFDAADDPKIEVNQNDLLHRFEQTVELAVTSALGLKNTVLVYYDSTAKALFCRTVFNIGSDGTGKDSIQQNSFVEFFVPVSRT